MTLAADEIVLASREAGDGIRQTDLSVPGIRCGGCIRKIEKALGGTAGVVDARVNLTARRVSVKWRGDEGPPPMEAVLADLGYQAHLTDSGDTQTDRTLTELIRALAVAGFATGNIMLLSVAVWSGAEAEARNTFHWISAAIALPVIAYSGRVFFRSAWSALRAGSTNMDVPIAIGILLAMGMSLYDTAHHGRHAYFDAAVMLVFFLLIGRTLDHVMRERARTAVKGLARLASRGAMVADGEGRWSYRPIDDIAPGMTVMVAAGERIPVDGRVLEGASDIDGSLVTGESAPFAAGPGTDLQGGTLNLTGPLTIAVTAAAEDSFLAEMVRLMEAAESGRSRYRRIADRASQLYAPVVHAAALAAFAGWMIAAGDVHQAVTIAVAVLIITCPCALGLAVPMVQVVAARRLFEHGVMVKVGSGLERLAEVDTVVFDKTGTLTMGQPRLCDPGHQAPDMLALAADLACHSRHPHSRALVEARPAGLTAPTGHFDRVTELPGFGVEAFLGHDRYRLGRADWVLDGVTPDEPSTQSRSVLSKNGTMLAQFAFDDPVRPEAVETLAKLKQSGLAVEILSGDHRAAVGALGRTLGIDDWSADMHPQDKVARIAALGDKGCRVLMVGDGLNDAPALAAAHVSIAPASAADIGRNAADFVFMHESLAAVPQALKVANGAARLVKQNFALAILYNICALPFAILGYVTPLFAALAMSSSSVIVVANALRLNRGHRGSRFTKGSADPVGGMDAPAAEVAK